MVCICRALLRQNKIILIDEATAHIDHNLDTTIQKLIRYQFKYCTVLTIAHRLSTLDSADKIMVMEEGKVKEFGTPAELREAGGAFSHLLAHNKDNKEELLS